MKKINILDFDRYTYSYINNELQGAGARAGKYTLVQIPSFVQHFFFSCFLADFDAKDPKLTN